MIMSKSNVPNATIVSKQQAYQNRCFFLHTQKNPARAYQLGQTEHSLNWLPVNLEKANFSSGV